MADLVLSVDVTSLADARKKLDGFQKAMNNLSVNRLASGIDSVQNSIKRLVEAQAKGTIGQNAYQKGLLELKRAYEQLGYSSQQATAAVRAYAAQLQRQRAAQEAARAAEELARAQAQAAARTRELRLRFQEGYAAFDRARQQMRDLRDAMRQGIITTDQYKQAVRELREEKQSSAVATEKLAQQSGVLRQRMSRASVAVQQFGYQTGDFLVQVQSGTNAFVAFGQQATQLAGLLTMSMNPATVALGAALSIAIPLTTAIAAGFMRTRTDAEKAAEETFNFVDALRELEEISDRENLFRGLGASVEREFEPLRNFLEAGIMEKIQEQFARTGEQLTAGFESNIQRELASIEEYTLLLQDLSDSARQQGMTEGLRLAMQDVNALLSEANDELDKQQGAWSIIRGIAGNTREEFARSFAEAIRRLEVEELMTQELRDSLFAFAEANGLASELARLLGNAADNAGRMTDNLVLSAEYQARAVRAGVASGAIPPQALQDLPPTASEVAYQAFLERRRREARRPQTPERTPAGGVDTLQQLEQRLQLEQDLLGKTEAQSRIIQALGINWRDYDESAVAALIATAEQLDNTNRKIAEQQKIADTIKDSMSDAFMSMVDGTKTVEDAFKGMARSIIKQLYDVLVVQQLVGSFNATSKTGSGIVGAIAGALLRESGGSMMPNQPYIVGERGPELVIPGRSATVKNADLTNKAMGGSNGVTVVNNINVSGGTDPAAIRQEVAKLMPQITNATKSAVIDARRRGGQMKAAFS
jgi:hypothetical protein